MTPVGNSHLQLVGSIREKFCIIIDDLADTCSTIARATEVLLQEGAKGVMAIVTHGIFSGDALDTLSDCGLSEIVVSNSVNPESYAKYMPSVRNGDAVASVTDKMENSEEDAEEEEEEEEEEETLQVKTFDISVLFSEAIRRIHNGESVSMLFNTPSAYQ